MTADGALRWGVKDSFVRYVLAIARGTMEVGEGASVDDEFVFTFPLRAAVREPAGWALAFDGAVTFTAHGGFLSVRIAGMRLLLGAESGVVRIDPSGGGESIPLATTGGAALLGSDAGRLRGRLDPVLTAEGAALFGGSYAVGTPLAPLAVAVETEILAPS